jgi:hypothetical protein
LLLAASLSTGCSLLEKEFETGRNLESDLNEDGTTTGEDAGDEGGDRPGDEGTDPQGSGSGSGDGSGSGSGSGSEDGSDSGSGSGDDASGSGESGDSGSEPGRVDCTPGAVAPDANLDTCVSDYLSCGDSVIGTTEGGNSVMDANDYVSWYCTPLPDGDYSGSERTYQITIPAGQKATFVLESPCDDLDIFVLRWELWQSNEQCPDYGNSVIECEADDSREGGTVEVFADPSRDTNYLVMIDGPDAEQVAFALDATCE